METIGDVMAHVFTPERTTRDVTRRQIDPDTLPPEVAESIGSTLVSNGNYAEGVRYLRSAVNRVPTCFAYTRIGYALSRAGLVRGAYAAYRKALELDSRSVFAIMGSASAVADVPQAPLHDLIGAVDEVLSIVDETDRFRVLRTLRSVLKAIARQFPDPELERWIRELEDLARRADTRTRAERQAELDRRIDLALRAAELLGTQMRNTHAPANHLGPGVAELPPGS